MPRSILFIHGAGEQDPSPERGGLAAYLREALNSYRLISPQMPQPEAPTYRAWRDAVTHALPEAGAAPYLVGHSLGGSVLLKYLSEEGAGERIGGLFLVAAPYWGLEHWEAAEYTLRADYTERLSPEVPVFIYSSRDDAVVPVSHAERYAREIASSRLRILEGRGHAFRSGLDELVADIRSLAPAG